MRRSGSFGRVLDEILLWVAAKFESLGFFVEDSVAGRIYDLGWFVARKLSHPWFRVAERLEDRALYQFYAHRPGVGLAAASPQINPYERVDPLYPYEDDDVRSYALHAEDESEYNDYFGTRPEG